MMRQNHSELEKPGHLYLGKVFNPEIKKADADPLLYDSKNLTTHALCVGMTGSGKTGLGIGLLEEVALSGIPALIIDPKGDLADLMLTFPSLSKDEFLPWIDLEEAARSGKTEAEYAESVAKKWQEGLASWGIGKERIQEFKNRVDVAIYTPASKSGISLSILNSFAAPPQESVLDFGALRDRILTTTSSLLGLIGIEADPINSREHILISTIFDHAWRKGKDLQLAQLIEQIQKPPFDKIGVLSVESFFPQKERLALSIKLNNLLASPGFHAWMEGEPLDIQSLLFTKEGRPKLAIVTISHLSDSERMFFVTLLLNELLSWMRRQSGTSSLRAVLYMDEIFGYFPPSSMPPSKIPMLTLLKQARAFGLGVILATQNPVDLDYKGLANCGTWFIGKLQTERDKARVLEGLNVATEGKLSQSTLSQMIASLGKRVFLLRSVHLPEVVLFETRWTMSYLRGPLTLPEIHKLMKDHTQKLARETIESHPLAQPSKPIVPIGVQEYFLKTDSADQALTYSSKVLAVAKLHFVDAKMKTDFWKEVALIAPAMEDGRDALWEQGEDVSALISHFAKTPPTEGAYKDLPAGLMESKSYALINKSFSDYLYQNHTYELFFSKDANLSSDVGECESDFRARVADSRREPLENDIKTINDCYYNKLRLIDVKIQKVLNKSEKQKSQAFRSKLDTFISFGTTLLNALLGRKFSKGSITQAGATLRKASRIGKEEEDVTEINESLISLQQQKRDLQQERDREILEAKNALSKDKIDLETVSIRPRKSDVEVELIALAWIPTHS